MLRIISDTFTFEEGKRIMQIEYDNKTDNQLVGELIQFIHSNQKMCTNCSNYYTEPCLCSYNAGWCKIHGNLTAYNNPHRDMDGTKCKDYRMKKNKQNRKDFLFGSLLGYLTEIVSGCDLNDTLHAIGFTDEEIEKHTQE